MATKKCGSRLVKSLGITLQGTESWQLPSACRCLKRRQADPKWSIRAWLIHYFHENPRNLLFQSCNPQFFTSEVYEEPGLTLTSCIHWQSCCDLAGCDGHGMGLVGDSTSPNPLPTWTTWYASGLHMGVPQNRATPKASILMGFSLINNPAMRVPSF